MSKRTSGMMLLSAAAVLGCGAVARAENAPPAKPHASVSLISETTGVIRGATAYLGLSFTIEKDWHIYWNGRNDSGTCPTAEFQLPQGCTLDAWQWPTPVREVLPGDILNHVYFDLLTLIVPLQVPTSAKPGTTITIKAHVQWLVCKDVCIAEEGDVSITLPVLDSGERPAPGAEAQRFAETRTRLAKPLPADGKIVSITWSNNKVKLSAPGASGLTFYPAEDCAELANPIAEADAKGSVLSLSAAPDKDHPALRGLLEVRHSGGKSDFYNVNSQPGKTSDGPSEKPSPQPLRR